MRKQGYRPSTIQATINTLKALTKQTPLLDPEAVKTQLAHAQVSVNRKEKICQDLARFYRYRGIHFDMPRYNRIPKLPFIPLEAEIDQLISGVGSKTATFLRLLKETGMRPGEAWNLKWIDLDLERSAVTITPEKGSNPRQLRISNRLIQMLSHQPHKWTYIFRNPQIQPEKSMRTFQKGYEQQRQLLAEKLQTPRIESISFRTLRHWKASTLYNKTRDILLVKATLGHRCIQSTLVYTHLLASKEDDFICKVAKDVKEAASLIELGYDYVTDVEGMKLFRKRK